MKKWLLNFYRKITGYQEPPWVPGKVWTNNVYIWDWDNRRIYGWNSYIKKDDEVRFPMASGKIARFRVIELEHKMDPKDQFFGTIQDIGYVEN